MALTRKFLTALGVEAEKVDEIINAHAETVMALKEERDRYKADADKLAETQKELDKLKRLAEEDFEGKYKALKEEYNQYKTDIETKQVQAKKTNAFKDILKSVGISEKRIEAIVKVSGEAISSLEFDKDDKLKGLDDLKKSVETEWADFIVKENVKGTSVDNPPKAAGDDNAKVTGRAAQLAAKYHEDLYGKAKED